MVSGTSCLQAVPSHFIFCYELNERRNVTSRRMRGLRVLDGALHRSRLMRLLIDRQVSAEGCISSSPHLKKYKKPLPVLSRGIKRFSTLNKV